MSLKLKISWKKILKWVGISLLAVLAVVVFVRLVVWEDNYYKEKEGSERAEVIVQEEEEEPEEELIEIEPTEEEVYEYIVPDGNPRYLTVEKLGIYSARILPMGVKDSGELKTPNNIFDVGWYEASGRPGEGGTMLIDGHNGGPHVHGVFKELPLLTNGDIIEVERGGDGVKFYYSVVESVEVLLTEADDYMSTALKSPERGRESVTLISCTGEWSDLQRTYLSRQFVRAVLMSRSDE